MDARDLLQSLAEAGEPFTTGEARALARWLAAVGETDPIVREDFLDRCRRDPAAWRAFAREVFRDDHFLWITGRETMTLTLNVSDAYELPPAGSLPARCCSVVDLGVQAFEYQGEIKRVHQIALSWQLEEFRSDGTFFVVSRRFAATLHPKSALRSFLEAWRGRPFVPEELKGFALPRLINAPCLLNIVHAERGGSTFALIKGASPLPRGMTPPPEVKDPIVFDLSDPRTWHVFDRLSKRQQEAIEATSEWKERQAIGNTAKSLADTEDDIAF